MSDNYYACVPALAWILGHYFFGGQHFTWIAEEYYPYRLPNPKSSNPHLIYQDLYQPWKDSDKFDKFVLQSRLNLRKGVIAKHRASVIDSNKASRLKRICDKVEVVFLYPLVYQLDVDPIRTATPGRLETAGSGAAVGSHEYLIKDLRQTEFSVLFLNYDSDAEFRQLVGDEIAKPGTTAEADALLILERRC